MILRLLFFGLLLALFGCASTNVKEYNRGYTHGELDQVHKDYWAIQNTQKNVQAPDANPAPAMRYESVPGPTQSGVIHLVPNQTTILTTQ